MQFVDGHPVGRYDTASLLLAHVQRHPNGNVRRKTGPERAVRTAYQVYVTGVVERRDDLNDLVFGHEFDFGGMHGVGRTRHVPRENDYVGGGWRSSYRFGGLLNGHNLVVSCSPSRNYRNNKGRVGRVISFIRNPTADSTTFTVRAVRKLVTIPGRINRARSVGLTITEPTSGYVNGTALFFIMLEAGEYVHAYSTKRPLLLLSAITNIGGGGLSAFRHDRYYWKRTCCNPYVVCPFETRSERTAPSTCSPTITSSSSRRTR